MTVPRTTYAYLLGSTTLLPLEECFHSRSRLAVMRGLANALSPPPKGRGRRTPLDERSGLPVVHPVRCMARDFQIFRESSPQLVYNPECEATLL